MELIAKLEAYECLQNLDSIIKASDGVMVARGGPGGAGRRGGERGGGGGWPGETWGHR